MKKTLLLIATAVMACTSAFGQWGNTTSDFVYVFPEQSLYESRVMMTPTGNTWLFFSYPEDGCSKYGLQLVDTLGNLVFGEAPLVVSDYPTRSYNVVNEFLTVDRKSVV